MSGKTFIDTNIFVYALDAGAPFDKAATARGVIRAGIAGRTGVVSYQVIQEFVNVALRKFEVPIAAADLADFIDRSFAQMVVVHSSVELFHQALSLQSRYRLSWYDSIIVAAATASGCATLYSEDMQDGARLGAVQVKNPFHPAR